MIIVELMGGLGNQMFQYAAGIAATKHLGMSLQNLRYDASFLRLKSSNKAYVQRKLGLDLFKISGKAARIIDIMHFTLPHLQNRFLYHGLRCLFPDRNIYKEGINKITDVTRNAYLSGYWQDATILKSIEDIIKDEFQFKDDVISPRVFQTGKLLRETEFATCVSFRRGDYVGHQDLGFLTMSYYKNALATLSKIIDCKAMNVFVFSDDINWCKQNFRPLGVKVTYVDEQFSDGTQEGDLFLMEQCQCFIIPNSTFHFWGGYLSQRENKVVIVPERYSLSQKSKKAPIWPNDWVALECN